MAYPIDRKLVIGVASSALFDLSESHQIYLAQGVDKYRIHQEKNIDNPFLKSLPFHSSGAFLASIRLSPNNCRSKSSGSHEIRPKPD
jgi:5'-nucleotidase